QREGGAARVGPAGGQRGYRRSQLLVTGVASAAERGRGDAVGAVLPEEQGCRSAAVGSAQCSALPHRDEQRAGGRALRDQADVGEGLVALVPPAYPQDPQSYGTGPYQPTGWSPADATRRPGRVKLARGVSYLPLEKGTA